MNNPISVFDIVGISAEVILFLSGLLIFAGILPLSKKISSKNSLNREAGKGMLIMYGAILGYNLAHIFADGWNGWITFLISVVLIITGFVGLRIFLRAMKEINKVARQENYHMNV